MGLVPNLERTRSVNEGHREPWIREILTLDQVHWRRPHTTNGLRLRDASSTARALAFNVDGQIEGVAGPADAAGGSGASWLVLLATPTSPKWWTLRQLMPNRRPRGGTLGETDWYEILTKTVSLAFFESGRGVRCRRISARGNCRRGEDRVLKNVRPLGGGARPCIFVGGGRV